MEVIIQMNTLCKKFGSEDLFTAQSWEKMFMFNQ